MIKCYFIMFLMLILSCKPPTHNENIVRAEPPTRSIQINDDIRNIKYQIINIDNCEYLVFDAYTAYQVVIHKANCKNHSN